MPCLGYNLACLPTLTSLMTNWKLNCCGLSHCMLVLSCSPYQSDQVKISDASTKFTVQHYTGSAEAMWQYFLQVLRIQPCSQALPSFPYPGNKASENQCEQWIGNGKFSYFGLTYCCYQYVLNIVQLIIITVGTFCIHRYYRWYYWLWRTEY